MKVMSGSSASQVGAASLTLRADGIHVDMDRLKKERSSSSPHGRVVFWPVLC